MDEFDFAEKQATPEWLTSILTKNGFLSKGSVSSIEQEVSNFGPAFISIFFSLKVEYSKESSGRLPSQIVMKVTNPEFYDEGQKEVFFYDAQKNLDNGLPLVTCYGAEKSTETKHVCLLFDDLTSTHYQPERPLPPTRGQCEEAIAALAEMHASWRNHASFVEPIFGMPSEERVRGWIQQVEMGFPKFVDFLGDRLPEGRRNAYGLIFQKLPRLVWSRLSSPERLTLMHGDAHYRNFLYPHNKRENRCTIIDWQNWSVGLGAADLSYMIALHWYPELRQRMEQPLLQFYLAEMQKRHVDYAWEEFWIDYRVSVMFSLLVPVFQHAMLEIPPLVWWDRLERGFLAFTDLGCSELL